MSPNRSAKYRLQPGKAIAQVAHNDIGRHNAASRNVVVALGKHVTEIELQGLRRVWRLVHA